MHARTHARRCTALGTAFGTALAAVLAGTGVVLAPAASAAVDLAPVWTVELPGVVVRESSVLAEDLDRDGVEDLVVGALDGSVQARSGRTGAPLPGWPTRTTDGVNSSPAAADVTGDGRPEVFIGSGNALGGSAQTGALYSYTAAGQQRFRVAADDRVACDGALCGFASPPVHSTPALGDVDRDGSADVSFGTLGLRSIWSVTRDGATRPGFPLYSDDTVFSSPALADLDGDGRTDLVVGTDATPGGPVDHQGGVLRALRGDGSQIWEFRADEIFRSSPAVGDVDGDGEAEVVIGTGDYYSARGAGSDHTRVFVLGRDGRLERTLETGGNTSGSPALADVDGDGRLDVVIGTGTRNGATGGGRVQAYDGRTGARILDTPPGARNDDVGAVSAADLDGDGRQDVLAGTGSGVYVRSGAGGALLASLNVGQVSYQNAPAVADVDGNGRLDVLLAGTRPDGTAVLQRWEATSTQGRVTAASWPTFRHDDRRTGNAVPPPLTQPPADLCGAQDAGYWLVARDGGIFSYCRSTFLGSTGGLRLNSPIVGMAPTATGRGYWLVAADGGVFTFGDARFLGSTGALRLTSPVVGMAATPSGAGYTLVAADGGVFTFGDARFLGSTGALRLTSPVVGMAATPSGAGYWLAAADGGVFAFGDAPFAGSAGGSRPASPVVGVSAVGAGGYHLVAADGGVFSYGTARFLGSAGARPLNQPVVGLAVTRG